VKSISKIFSNLLLETPFHQIEGYLAMWKRTPNFTLRMNQQVIGMVLREINLLAQLAKQFIANDDQTVV